MDKIPFDEKIETEQLILKPYDLTFKMANIVFNTIKENWDFLTHFIYNMQNIKAPEDIYAFFVKENEKSKNMDGICYAIWTKDGDFIGCCDLKQYPDLEAELAYWLAEKYTNKGYMTEAIKAIEKNLFDKGFNRLSIIMDTENAASEKVAIRCGFTKEGIMREWSYNPTFNSYRDMYLYSKLKDDWEKENE